eukprot:s1247_g28.t1
MQVRFLSGEILTQLSANEFQGTSVKALKQSLGAQVGVPRFRHKLFLEDGSEIPDDTVFGSEAVKLLLVVLDFCPADAEEQKSMVLACEENDLDALEEFLRRPYNPNMIIHNDVMPLQSAAARGHLEAMQLLIEAGHLEAMQLLIEAGAELEILASGFTCDNFDCATPLFYAAQRGNLEMVQVLIEACADPHETGYHARSANFLTPLEVASSCGHGEVVHFLTSRLGSSAAQQLSSSARAAGHRWALCLDRLGASERKDLAWRTALVCFEPDLE